MASSASAASAKQPRSDRCLYVGNLHPSVDEYTLIQTYTKYGKVTRLDYLFHKAGPMKGKPRGYAFVEYNTKEEALKAMVETHDKLLRGRKLSVTYANQVQHPDGVQGVGSSGGVGPHRRPNQDAHRPTTLSLIKNASVPKGTNAKIAALEAKLAAMKKEGDQRRLGSPASGSSSPPPVPAPRNADASNSPTATRTSRSVLSEEARTRANSRTSDGGRASRYP